MKRMFLLSALLLIGLGSVNAQETGKVTFKFSDGFYTGLNNGGLAYNEVSVGCDIASAVGITVDFQTPFINSNRSMGFSGTLSALPEAEGRFSCEPYLKIGADKGVFHLNSEKLKGFCAFGASLDYQVYDGFYCCFDASFVFSKNLALPILGIKFSYKL